MIVKKIRQRLKEINSSKTVKPSFDELTNELYDLGTKFNVYCDFSHYQSYSYFTLCGHEELQYKPLKCIHFTVGFCRTKKIAYCIPYETLKLRRHRIGNCPDGDYRKTR